MRAGDIARRVLKFRTASGPALGLTIADLNITALGCGYAATEFSAYTHGSTLAEISGGRYRLAHAAPPSAGWGYYEADPVSSLIIPVGPNIWTGEIENQDLDSAYGAMVRPTASLTASAQLGMPLPLQLVAYRQRELTIPVVDQDRNPYTQLETDYPTASLRMAVRSQDQTSVVWEAGPSATPAGFAISTVGSSLLITIPENATFFSALATGQTDRSDLYWEVIGDFGGDASKTRPIIRSSQVLLTRREYGIP